jgi:protein-disulfide isomerase
MREANKMRRVLLVAAMLACATPSQPKPTQAAAPIPCGIAPVGSSAAVPGTCEAAPVVIAKVGAESIRDDQLSAEVRAKIAGLDAAVGEARRKELRRVIDQTLLELEAARLQTTLFELWKSEVLQKTPAASDAEIQALWAKKFSAKKIEDAHDAIARQVSEDLREKREAEVAHELEARFPVALKASPSTAGTPEQVLAIVGERSITRAAAAARLDAAEYLVRVDVWFAEYQAASEVAAHKEMEFQIAQPAPSRISLDLAGAPSRGGAAGAVTVVEFGDFQCPPCGHMWKVVEEALAPFGDKVRYVFVDDPLPMHERAQKSAEAARAAHAQGHFFDYANLLFTNQKSLDDASLKKFAGDLGLDTTRLQNDLDNGRYSAEVLFSRRLALRSAALGTPTFLVDGMVLPFASFNVEGIRAAVNAALAKRN